MHRLGLALLLGLAACGEPFAAALFADAAPEGGDSAPADQDASGGAEAGVTGDGGKAEATTAEGAGPGDAAGDLLEEPALEAGDGACLPFAFDAEGCFAGPHTSAAVPVFVGGAWDGGCGGTYTATPPACVCDFTCACLQAHASELAACDPGGWQSCAMANAGHPVVSCQ